MRKPFSRLARAAQVKPAGSRRARLQVRALEERCCLSGGAVEWSDPIPIYNQSGSYGYTGAAAYSAVVQPSGRIVFAGTAVLSNKLAVTLAESDCPGGASPAKW